MFSAVPFLALELPEDPGWRSTYLRWMGVAFVLYVATAVWAPGFWHPDEHFQIVEFAWYRLGGVGAEALPWELDARIRPWFQPATFAALHRAMAALGVESHFSIVTAYRVSMALVGWLGTACTASLLPRWFDDHLERRVALVGLAVVYYAPLFHARTSSDSLSSALMMCALPFVVRSARWRGGLAAGLLLGFAYLARFQVGMVVPGVLAWGLVVDKRRPSWAVALAGGAIAVALAGLAIDAWGYGEWGLTPWRYVAANLFEGKASSFGVRPWHAYFGLVWHDLEKPFGALVLAGFLVTIVRWPRHVLVWALVPFVLVHFFIGHKETRFLLPLLFCAPIFVVLAVKGRWARAIARSRWRFVAVVLLVLNGWWLIFLPELQAGPWLNHLDAGVRRTPGPVVYDVVEPLTMNGPLVMSYYGVAIGPTERVPEAAVVERARAGAPTFWYYRWVDGAPEPNAELDAVCERVYVGPPPRAWFPEAWFEHYIARRAFRARESHEVYRCP